MQPNTQIRNNSIPMSPTLKFDLEGDGLPIRLDLFLRHELPNLSRTEVQRLIRSGAARLNSRKVTTPSTKIKAGDELEFNAPGPPVPLAPPIPQNLEFDVVFEDEHIIVVDKPAGLAVHAGAGRRDGNLVNGLIARYPDLTELEPVERPGIVHRLDADTSGLMLVARTVDAAAKLAADIKAHDVGRWYIALIDGKISGHPRGMIDRPIGRHPRIRTKQAVVQGGKPARTAFFVLAHYWILGRNLTLIQLHLETGRTHQIRVHMQAIGHPLIGDPVYGVTPQGITLGRQFLHAHRIEFDHPATGETLAFSSPLHEDLSHVLQHQIDNPSFTQWGAGIV